LLAIISSLIDVLSWVNLLEILIFVKSRDIRPRLTTMMADAGKYGAWRACRLIYSTDLARNSGSGCGLLG
jgi:hypothetical protein